MTGRRGIFLLTRSCSLLIFSSFATKLFFYCTLSQRKLLKKGEIIANYFYLSMLSCDDRRHLVPEVLRGGDGVIYIHTIDLGKLK